MLVRLECLNMDRVLPHVAEPGSEESLEDLAPNQLPHDVGCSGALHAQVRVLGAALKLPIVCRHVDWGNTVPLQTINSILKAAQSQWVGSASEDSASALR